MMNIFPRSRATKTPAPGSVPSPAERRADLALAHANKVIEGYRRAFPGHIKSGTQVVSLSANWSPEDEDTHNLLLNALRTVELAPGWTSIQIPDIGALIRRLNGALDVEDEDFNVYIAFTEEGAVLRDHAHPQREILVVLRGEVEVILPNGAPSVTLRGEERSPEASFYYFEPGVAHTLIAKTSSVLAVTFRPKLPLHIRREANGGTHEIHAAS